ncbi:MAG TPA: hypothetical protein VGE34_04120 [Candidatus Saccharimonadales bacterium]
MPSFEEIIAAQRESTARQQAHDRDFQAQLAAQRQELTEAANSLRREQKMVGIALGRSSRALSQADRGVRVETYDGADAFYYRSKNDSRQAYTRLSNGSYTPVWQAGGYSAEASMGYDEVSVFFPLYVDDQGKLRSTGSTSNGWTPDPNSAPRVVPISDSTDFEKDLYTNVGAVNGVRTELARLVVKFDLNLGSRSSTPETNSIFKYFNP